MKFRCWQQPKHEMESNNQDWGSRDGDSLPLLFQPPPPPPAPKKRKTNKTPFLIIRIEWTQKWKPSSLHRKWLICVPYYYLDETSIYEGR
jgi:hypothetical protein